MRVRREDDLQESRIKYTVVMCQREDIDKKEQPAEHCDTAPHEARQKRAKECQQQREPRHAQQPFQEQQRHALQWQGQAFI